MTINGVEIKPREKQTVELHVAYLPTRTPITIPVTVYDSGEEGPTVLLMAGLHGDEINGMETLRRFMKREHYKVNRGKIICIPILNIFGFIHFSREVPDGKDVNRSFPGSKKGSLASKVAHLLMQEIIPHIDYGLDFHTGGNQISNYPQIRADLAIEKNNELADFFNAPMKIHSSTIKNSLRWAAQMKGKHILVYEGGESLRFNGHVIEEAVNGSLRFLHALGMIDDAPEQELEPITIDKRVWIRCVDSGLWILNSKEGDRVKKGDLLGYTTGPFGDFESPIYAPKDGVIISINYMCVVNKGDALIHLGILE